MGLLRTLSASYAADHVKHLQMVHHENHAKTQDLQCYVLFALFKEDFEIMEKLRFIAAVIRSYGKIQLLSPKDVAKAIFEGAVEIEHAQLTQTERDFLLSVQGEAETANSWEEQLDGKTSPMEAIVDDDDTFSHMLGDLDDDDHDTLDSASFMPFHRPEAELPGEDTARASISFSKSDSKAERTKPIRERKSRLRSRDTATTVITSPPRSGSEAERVKPIRKRKSMVRLRESATTVIISPPRSDSEAEQVKRNRKRNTKAFLNTTQRLNPTKGSHRGDPRGRRSKRAKSSLSGALAANLSLASPLHSMVKQERKESSARGRPRPS